ncbi:MAG: Hsp20/alpha crystallin family protein [Jiangellaceae bacterium]
MSTRVLRRDPFVPFDALFRSAFVPGRDRFVPAVEVVRDGDDALVRVELPGLDAERDVTVEVDQGRLVVRGERRDERADERNGHVLREVRYGTFRRSFGLRAHVTGDDVTATYDAGVLTVRVAGAYAGTTARRIPVSASGAEAVEADASEEQAAA